MKKSIVQSVVAILTIGSFFYSNIVYSQTSLNAGSHQVNIGHHHYEYSIGEMILTSTEHHSNLIVTQGFLQPQLNSSATTTQVDPGWEGNIMVYPNPVQNILNIEFNSPGPEEYSIQLLDMTGNILYQQLVEKQSSKKVHSMNLSAFTVGSYLLVCRPTNIAFNDQMFIYKIQKTN